MAWYIWIPLAVFGAASVYCFMRSYRHLRPEVEGQAHRLALRGPLMRQNLFDDRGSRLRLLGWMWACLAMAALIAAGLVDK